MNPFVTANGKPVAAQLSCSLEEFLLAQKLSPRRISTWASLNPKFA
jgi:cobalamin biosynthesis protein CbiG